MYVTNRVNPEHFPSKPISNYRAAPKIKGLNNDSLDDIDDEEFSDNEYDDVDDSEFSDDEDNDVVIGMTVQ